MKDLIYKVIRNKQNISNKEVNKIYQKHYFMITNDN